LATMAALAASPAETLRTAMTTCTPRSTRTRAVSSPMPLVAPARLSSSAQHMALFRRKWHCCSELIPTSPGVVGVPTCKSGQAHCGRWPPWDRSDLGCEVSICTRDDGDETMAVDAGSDLLSRWGAGEARGPFAVEPPHQAVGS
jgi:hypothetical protein